MLSTVLENEMKSKNMVEYRHTYYVHTLTKLHQEAWSALHITSEPFIKLCSEASEGTTCFYLSWNRVPDGCAREGEASFEKVCSRFGNIIVREERLFQQTERDVNTVEQDFCMP